MRTIFSLVGQSGAGKTTLIQEIVKRFPEKISIVKSLTTRARRNKEDDLFYEFVTVNEMRRKEAEKQLIQISEYAGNLYANDRGELDELLKHTCGINALVEAGVSNLRRAGYPVTVIKVLPVHHAPAESIRSVKHDAPISANGLSPQEEQRIQKRQEADRTRAQIHLPADFILNNSFDPGGMEKALEQLANYIQTVAR